MSQHDYNITPEDATTGQELRVAINEALQALASCSSGPTAPVVTYPNQLWADWTEAWLKIRNSQNSGWIYVLPIAPFIRQLTLYPGYNQKIPLGTEFILAGDLTGQPGTYAILPLISDFLNKSVTPEIVIKTLTGGSLILQRSTGSTDTIEGASSITIPQNSVLRLRAASETPNTWYKV